MHGGACGGVCVVVCVCLCCKTAVMTVAPSSNVADVPKNGFLDENLSYCMTFVVSTKSIAVSLSRTFRSSRPLKSSFDHEVSHTVELLMIGDILR